MALDPAGGVVVYLRQEGRGIGLGEKLKAYNLQDLGNDTVQANLILRHPADARSYGLATAILKDLELSEIRLLTNNPDKIAAVEGPGKEVRVVERVPMIPLAWKNMKGGVTGKEVGEYLRTKVGFPGGGGSGEMLIGVRVDYTDGTFIVDACRSVMVLHIFPFLVVGF